MAYSELQTAAVRFIHVSRPTDRDADYLLRELHLSPADVEAILGVAGSSIIFEQPAYRRLTVQWPIVTRRGLELTDIHCFVGTAWVAIVDYGHLPIATDLMTELRTLPPEHLWQDNAMMVLYEFWRRAIRSIPTEATLTPRQSQALIQARVRVGQTLKHFADAASAADHEVQTSWRWLAFTLQHSQIVPTRAIGSTKNHLPLTARSYAAASAVVVIATLLAVSQTL